MDESQAAARLALVKDRRWQQDLFMERYGIDMWSGESSAAAQFRIWAERYDDGRDFLGPSDVDRWMFELFLQHREWVPISLAAVQHAMSPSDFKTVLGTMVNARLISPKLEDGEVSGMYPSNFLRDLPKRLSSFPRGIFSSRTSYIRAFHVAVQQDLALGNIQLITCSTAHSLCPNDNEEAVYEYDIITREPIGIANQVWLDFGKPLALKPDACSLLTYARFETLLKPYSMGGPHDELLEKARSIVRAQGI